MNKYIFSTQKGKAYYKKLPQRVGKSIRLPDFNSNEGTTLQQKPRLRGLSRQTDLFAEREYRDFSS